MPRYIDADALMERFRDARHIAATSERYDMAYGFKIAISMVENAPTDDVAPVLRGRWLVAHDEYGICATEFTCSECKETYCSSEYTDDEFIESTKFCPNCGARMDMEDNE